MQKHSNAWLFTFQKNQIGEKIHSNYYTKKLINWVCSSLQQNMATVYDMCAVTEVIYCDIKNINGQYNVVKKFIYK